MQNLNRLYNEVRQKKPVERWEFLTELANLNVERSISSRIIFPNKMVDITPLRKQLQFQKEVFIKSTDIPEFKELPSVCVDVAEIIPTQGNIYLRNLEATNGINGHTGAYLVLKGGKYYIFDGHHRIANRILQGYRTACAYLFTPTETTSIFNRACAGRD